MIHTLATAGCACENFPAGEFLILSGPTFDEMMGFIAFCSDNSLIAADTWTKLNLLAGDDKMFAVNGFCSCDEPELAAVAVDTLLFDTIMEALLECRVNAEKVIESKLRHDIHKFKLKYRFASGKSLCQDHS